MSDTDLIPYLDAANRLDYVQAYKRQSLDMLNARPGDRILEVGCGPGMDTLALAGRMSGTGHVVGLDNSPVMIREARRRAQGCAAAPDYLVASALQLSFGAGVFDGCRADRVLHTLPDPWPVLTELARVARPGARLVVHEPDWGTLAIDAPGTDLTRRILNYICDNVPSGWLGRQLPRLFNDLHLKDIQVVMVSGALRDFEQANNLFKLEATVAEAVEAGAVAWVEGFGWLQALRQASREGAFFTALSGVTACGLVP